MNNATNPNVAVSVVADTLKNSKMKTVFSLLILSCFLFIYCQSHNESFSLKRRNLHQKAAFDAQLRYQQKRRYRYRERRNYWPKSKKSVSGQHQLRPQSIQHRNEGKSLVTRLAAHVQVNKNKMRRKSNATIFLFCNALHALLMMT